MDRSYGQCTLHSCAHDTGATGRGLRNVYGRTLAQHHDILGFDCSVRGHQYLGCSADVNHTDFSHGGSCARFHSPSGGDVGVLAFKA